LDPAEVLAWTPLPPVGVTSTDLQVAVSPFATGWNRALRRPIEIALVDLGFEGPRPKVVSVPIRRPMIRARSFVFPTPLDPPGPLCAPPATDDRHQPGVKDPSAALNQATRIAPPADVIKLEDRLHYVLQPPLESLFRARSLRFPHAPFPYQMDGVAFLYPRHAAVLADEMGLGKTMQAVTAARLLLHGGEARSVLLVCPKPLVSNWHREFALWAPEIPVVVVEGDQPRRRWQWGLTDIPVKIANYEVLNRDRELFEEGDRQGRRLHFDLVILDEAQRIKNRARTTWLVVRAIGRGRSWALTGTPVENCPEDLVGVFEFVSPGFLSPDMKPSRMGRTVRDYLLRRTKEQVLADLPPKLFRDAEIELTPEQRETYDLARDEGVLRLTRMGESATIQHVFELVLRLKQICNFDPATGASAKLERLEADLEEVATSGRKALVFSQWVQTLRQLAGPLARFGPVEYHGEVPASRRDEVLRRFRDDPDCHVMLLSYGAGGVGLNLQFAHYVFLFDRWWNPAVEDQAINRAHRIGVSGPITVTRFLALDTIEERIDSVLREKRELFDLILSGAEGHRRLGLTQEEIFGLFDLRSPAGTDLAQARSRAV
jgi:SNF2 family DNA or RNA helicase